LSPAVEVSGVAKSFRPPATLRGLLGGRLRGAPVVALSDVSLEAAGGEALGLMGPNGAGKSTLLRILAGLVTPSAGTVRVCGADAARGGPALLRHIGWVAADERGLTPHLSPREHLRFFAALAGFDAAGARARVAELLALLGLEEVADRRLRELSTGMRRRALLGRALLGRPAVLLLDEPTRGVDPAGVAALHAHLLALRDAGTCLVLATHDRDEAELLCARVAVLDHARLLVIEAPAAAVARLKGVPLD
jgi:ABC-2 type transport system ATP-binding protein